MAVYIGFLRAINLGARRKFSQASIIEATVAAGFDDVVTHVNTGNVRFSTRLRSRARIEAALEASYAAAQGFEVPTIVFTQEELREIATAAEVIGAGYAGTHYVSLLKQAPSADLAARLETLGDDHDHVHVRGRAVHLLVLDPYRHTRLSNATVEKQLGVATNRNLTVIRALAEKWC